jgi:hypothetical protein
MIHPPSGIGGLAAMGLVAALGCAAASRDPLFGARPLPPLSAPRTTAPPARPQVLVVQETAPTDDPPDPAPAAPAFPSSPATSADPAPLTPLELERSRNEAAFDRDYLRAKERLFDLHVGHWLAIVDGRLLPADARGRPAPTLLLADALAAADAANRDALHRFLFRIGEEGDVAYPDPGGAPQPWIGMALKLQHGIAATFDPAAPAVLWTRAGSSRRFSVVRDQIEILLADPTGRQTLAARATDSSSYGGFIALDSAPADLLDAERFEIPGRVVLTRADSLRELRRTRLRVQVAELELDALVPAAVWID